MMSAVKRKQPFEIRREIANPLSPIEREVLRFCERAAAEQRPLDSIEEITQAIGATGVSTVPGIMKRLEAKGYIRRTIYQRGRQVEVLATGQKSAPPPCLSPHWRTRVETVPTPAIQAVRERSKSIAAMIEAEARMTGKHFNDLLADLVYIGWHEYQAEKERGE